MKHLILAIAILLLGSSGAFAADPVITVLNTATGESGPAQTTKYNFSNTDKPITIVVDLSTGDTVKVQGRATSSDSWIDIYSFTADEWKQFYMPRQWRVIRSTNGGVGAATAKVVNIYDLPLTAH